MLFLEFYLTIKFCHGSIKHATDLSKQSALPVKHLHSYVQALFFVNINAVILNNMEGGYLTSYYSPVIDNLKTALM